MILALYIIGTTAVTLLMAARLREAQQELARMRGEHREHTQAIRDEYAAYADGVSMTLSCLLAAFAVASFYAPHRKAGE